MKKPIFASIAALLLFAHSALAEPKALEALLDSPTRPTIEDVIEAVGPRPDQAYAAEISTDNNFIVATRHLEALAQSIAVMEYMYPGAIWAPLGRDAVIFGDAVDAFYTHLGATNRVVRLNASGPSIREQTPDKLVRFLQSAGMNLEQSARPFVGLDRTGYGSNSQARWLLNAAYSDYSAKVGNTRQLPLRLNFLGLLDKITDVSSDRINDFLDMALKKTWVEEVLQLHVGRWTDTAAWTESFGELGEQMNGKYEGELGRRMSTYNAKAVLGELVWILRNVATERFLGQVLVHAQKLGYDFIKQVKTEPRLLAQLAIDRVPERAKIKRQQQIAEAKQYQEKMIALLKLLTQRFWKEQGKSIDADYIAFTWMQCTTLNSFSHFRPFKKTTHSADYIYAKRELLDGGVLNANFFVLHLISEATLAFDQRRLNNDEYRSILTIAFRSTNPNPDFYTEFEKVSTRYPTLKKVLIDDELYFSHSVGKNTPLPEVEKVYAEIFKHVYRIPRTAAQTWERKKIEQILDKRTLALKAESDSWSAIPSVERADIEKRRYIYDKSQAYESALRWLTDSYSEVRRARFDVLGLTDSQKVSLLRTTLIAEATRRFDQKKLDLSDYRQIIAAAMGYAQGDSVFFESMRELITSHPNLRKVLFEEQVFFTTPFYLRAGLKPYVVSEVYRQLRGEVLHSPINDRELKNETSAALLELKRDFLALDPKLSRNTFSPIIYRWLQAAKAWNKEITSENDDARVSPEEIVRKTLPMLQHVRDKNIATFDVSVITLVGILASINGDAKAVSSAASLIGSSHDLHYLFWTDHFKKVFRNIFPSSVQKNDLLKLRELCPEHPQPPLTPSCEETFQ